MKRCPYAEWDPLGTQTQPAMQAHDIICLHTMVGYGYTTRVMFKQNGYGGTESTYGVAGNWGADDVHDLDGHAWQWQDRSHTADANLQGNPRIISIETGDNAASTAARLPRWTPKQVTTLVNIIAWECSIAAHSECPSDWDCRKGTDWEGMRVAIPPVLVPDSKSYRRGIAYHRQGCDPWRVTGGEKWSISYGKECPGPVRISQLRTEIIPKVQQKMKGEDMPTEKEFWQWDGITAPEREPDKTKNPHWMPASYLPAILNTIDTVAGDIDDTLAQVEANRDAIAALKLDEVYAKVIAAGDEAAAKVTAAGNNLLAALDKVRIDIERGDI